ncbi:MAG: LamG-like jellyroll fold domain-containing protein, partial [Bacteroidota bacterium]
MHISANSFKFVKSWKSIGFMLFVALLFTAGDLYAQYYEFTLNQRRRYDQIHVEIWARAVSASAPRIGNASLVLEYNSEYLQPSASQSLSTTDSINVNINRTDPVDDISSQFAVSANGYNSLTSQAYSSGYYSLEINQANIGQGGIVPSSGGRGSFVGRLSFDITGSPSESAMTEIGWSNSTMPGDIRIFDADSNDIESQTTFTDPADFTVVGITVLSPNKAGIVVDRDQNYASLLNDYASGGYPVYFERSVNPANYTAPAGAPPAIDADLAYLLQYSLDNGATWTDIGRVAETDLAANQVTGNNFYASGEIYNAATNNSYIITTQEGTQLLASNYRKPVRVIWSKNPFFTERSEQARLRVIRLQGSTNTSITSRQKSSVIDMNDAKFVLGRLFFMQLNGTSEYLKTETNFSNSTQLTVETWLNLNSYQDYGSEPGIVVSSGGPGAAPVYNSNEGAWMLYLEDGRYPAFRVREIQARGENGYLGKVVAYRLDSLMAESDAEPLDQDHSGNWVHLTATVNNNEISLYVNGELVDRRVNDSTTDIRMMTTVHPVWIGVNPNGSIDASDYLHAGIKGVRVWRTALTQDEIRNRVAGVSDPTNVSTYGDLRRGLELYYTFEGEKDDEASNSTYQNGAQALDFYSGGVADDLATTYRPDQPHIRLTAPTGGVGVSNINGKVFDIRWVSYGLGDISTTGTADLAIEYSIDGGSSWNYARNPAGSELGGALAVDVETGTAQWEPYENNNASANLRTINPYAREVSMRMRGTSAFTQSNLTYISDDFWVAPYFALPIEEGDILAIDGEEGMNITSNVAFIEGWIRPYRFPTEEEGYFPILAKRDSNANELHYEFNLLPTGQLQLKLMDATGNERTATSDIDQPIVRPNSVSLDSAWTHVAAYVFLNSGLGQSEVRFYIDGTVQRADSIATQLGEDLSVNFLNDYPTYIGYNPGYTMVTWDTIPQQTQNVTISGNIYSGTPEDFERTTSAQIYDAAGNEHTLELSFVKTDQLNEYNFTQTIDGNDIARQTEQVSLTGTLDANAAEGDAYTIDGTIQDMQNDERDLELVFTRNADPDEYTLQINIDGNTISENIITFNNGVISSPFRIEVEASDINTAIGAQDFDAATPKNLAFVIADSTNPTSGLTLDAAAGNTADVSVMSDNLVFNTNGSLSQPQSIMLYAYDLNLALGSAAFDETAPMNIDVNLTNVTQLQSETDVNISNQDGSASAPVQNIVTSDNGNGNFIGEIREVRLWNGLPNNVSASGTEPTDLTLFVQGAQSVSTDSLLTSSKANLAAAYSFNGGSFIKNGYNRAVGYYPTTNSIVRHYGNDLRYVPAEPYVKLVEPAFKERVTNTATDVRVRWIGFNYNGQEFNVGANQETPPSLEFSIRGGGGKVIQPYQYLGGRYWQGNTQESMSLPTNSSYLYSGGTSSKYFASQVNASIADPDENDDGSFNDQGPLAAALTNARFRLTAKYTINGEQNTIQSEGPLFTVTPASNFTVRVLLEGYHNGVVAGNQIRNIGTSFDEGGLRIKLYRDNSGGIGALIDSAESTQGYDERDPTNRNAGNMRFGNVNFVFTEITDGNYWVVVEHINHMPVMSRFSAPFQYVGDNRSTWPIESGWDFESWNGTDDNVLPSATTNPWSGNYFTAYGNAIATSTKVGYSTTGLVFNNGVAGGSASAMPALVGGDIVRDGMINAADRVRVRVDAGTSIIGSDVTGDGLVNADDRTIVDRNHGKVSSLYDISFPTRTGKNNAPQSNYVIAPPDVNIAVAPENPGLSARFNRAAESAMNNADAKISGDRPMAGPLDYEVWTVPEVNGSKVDLHFYIKNKGRQFGLANCTFAVKYNSSMMDFAKLSGTGEVIFTDTTAGYNALTSAPDEGMKNAIPDMRTIEIDYDAFANPGGIA